MVQAARSGKQNIAEGNQAGATSSETEIKLTNVAKASLEELLVDYEDYLRTAHPSSANTDNGAWVSCNCPICHAEDYLATEAENFEYHPVITTLECEFGVIPTAQANRIVVTSSLRGPPCLS
jgi:hypothetical protein